MPSLSDTPGALDAASTLHTLLVEDDRAYARIVQCTLRRTRPGQTVYHVSDGGEALDYVFGRGDFADREKFPLPGIILLDLRMPRVDGFEVLRQLKGNPATQTITVVVMTSSDLVSDQERCHEYGADEFVTKPSEIEELSERLTAIYQSHDIQPHG
jgi:two-component system, response regulator